jgi:hypothetical protein
MNHVLLILAAVILPGVWAVLVYVVLRRIWPAAFEQAGAPQEPRRPPDNLPTYYDYQI